MNPAELANKTLALLTSTFSHGTVITEGVATRLLGDMVARRLARAGHEGAWKEFENDPKNSALTKTFLLQILHNDHEFRAQLESALASATQESTKNSEQHGVIHNTGSGDAQIGNRGDTIQGSNRVATRGGTYNERARITNKTTRKTPGGPAVVVAAAVVVLLAFLLFEGATAILHKLEGGSLSGNSTCQDFLSAPQAEQQAVIQSLATQYDKPDYVTPLGEPEVSYYCASNPSTTLGQFFANAQD
jgi:hypothetical protein